MFWYKSWSSSSNLNDTSSFWKKHVISLVPHLRMLQSVNRFIHPPLSRFKRLYWSQKFYRSLIVPFLFCTVEELTSHLVFALCPRALSTNLDNIASRLLVPSVWGIRTQFIQLYTLSILVHSERLLRNLAEGGGIIQFSVFCLCGVGAGEMQGALRGKGGRKKGRIELTLTATVAATTPLKV